MLDIDTEQAWVAKTTDLSSSQLGLRTLQTHDMTNHNMTVFEKSLREIVGGKGKENG